MDAAPGEPVERGLRPGDRTVDVPVNLPAILVRFNQPISSESGAGNAQLAAMYRLAAMPSQSEVGISTVSFDSTFLTASIFFDHADPDWQAGQTYEFTVDGLLANLCGVPQSANVRIRFMVEQP